MQPPLGAVTLGGDVGAGSLDARAAVVDGEERGGRPKVGGKGCGSYLIVSMQRSGTTTICTDINNIKGKFKKRPGQATNSSVGDFVCQYELLNSGELQSGHRFLEETNHTPAWAAKHPQEMVRQAAQKARNKWGACVWGFKVFDKQLAAVDQIADRFDKCIIYRRENITAQYLSWKTAEETDCWETTPAEQAANPACAEKVTTLGKDWPDFQERVRAWYNVSETACRKAGKPVEFITMEKYLAPKWQTYAQEVARMRARVKQP
jgi:LPS sulfotransferase NodH